MKRIILAVGFLIVNYSLFAQYAVGYELIGWGNVKTPTAPLTDIVKIAAGRDYSLALKSDGSIIGWGDNNNGPTTPPAGNDFAAIAAGYDHSLALKSDGSIVGWGYNDSGQATPPAGNEFVAIAAGYAHSLALKSDGSIVGWGWNGYGQATPPAGNDFVAIAAGMYHSLALKSDGSIVGWGYNYNHQATPPAGNNFVAIAAGYGHNLALKSDGSIICWGTNWHGEATPPKGNDFIAIAAGYNHILALKSNGSIVGWGNNYDYTGHFYYGQATPPAGNDFVAIVASQYQSLALRNHHPFANAGADQTVYAWIDGKAKVVLDGSNSNDPDGDALTYKWTWVVGANTYEANGVSPAIELPVGVHKIQLVVNDGRADSAPDDVNITVIAPVQGNLCVMPSTINRQSHEPCVLANLRLPDGIGRGDIDCNEPITLYPGASKAAGRWIIPSNERGHRFVSIFAFFDKDDLMAAVPQNGIMPLKVAGKLKNGHYFYGCDTARIIDLKSFECKNLK